jgi:transposase-like protein
MCSRCKNPIRADVAGPSLSLRARNIEPRTTRSIVRRNVGWKDFILVPFRVADPSAEAADLWPNVPTQRCTVHRSQSIIDRLPKSLYASVRKTLRQARELDDSDTAEKLRRNLARRLEGIDEIIRTVTRLGLPPALRRLLARTNIIENMMGSIRQTCRNMKRRRNVSHGPALNRRGHDRSRQRLPKAEGS